MHQIIKFIAKISLEGQANGLPPEIYGVYALQDANNQTINDAVAAQFVRYRQMGGMIVDRNQGALADMQVNWLTRRFIGFEWIVEISVSLTNLTREISTPDESGVERTTDGKEVPRQ